MKGIIFFALFSFALSVNAQKANNIWSSLYGDLHLGLMFVSDYASGGAGVGIGYRFNDRHSLGLALVGFSEISTSTSRSASGIGPLYRYQMQRWSIDGSVGYVQRFRYRGDDPYPPHPVHKRSNPWYFRVGLQRKMKGIIHLGISYARSGAFTLEYTDTDMTPPEVRSHKTLGVHGFTLNLILLFQNQKNF